MGVPLRAFWSVCEIGKRHNVSNVCRKYYDGYGPPSRLLVMEVRSMRDMNKKNQTLLDSAIYVHM